MKKYLLVDVDDTLLGWADGFKVFAEKELGKNLIGKPDQYCMSNWLGINKTEILNLIQDFNNNHEDFGNLKPILKAEIYLPKFKEGGYEIVAVTASSDKHKSIERRKNNLYNVFGKIFSDIHCVANAEDKKKHLQKYPPSIFVEDKIFNAEMGLEFNHKPIIIRQLHSIEHEPNYSHLTWVNDWEEIYEIINRK